MDTPGPGPTDPSRCRRLLSGSGVARWGHGHRWGDCPDGRAGAGASAGARRAAGVPRRIPAHHRGGRGRHCGPGCSPTPDWVDRWDVAFARLYLDALEAGQRGEPVPAPWAVAFGAAEREPRLPAVRHVLLGMNAHINYDLPQALLAVISDEEFGDPAVRAAQGSRPPPDRRGAGRAGARGRRRTPAARPGGTDLAGPGAPAAEPAGHAAVPPRGPGQGVGQRAGAQPGPAGRTRTATRAAWPSWRSCAAGGSRTWSGPARCCSGWRWAASASGWRPEAPARAGGPSSSGARCCRARCRRPGYAASPYGT